MSRYDLSDFEWRVIEPLLPNKPRGVPRGGDCAILNRFSECCGPVRRGATYPNAVVHVPPATTLFVRWRRPRFRTG
jgi:transposase